uniref:Uncharacterized protein n=1 Tax=Plectus sambesii TaxID=2011161 RepID=A0A914XNU1_9BILA
MASSDSSIRSSTSSQQLPVPDIPDVVDCQRGFLQYALSHDSCGHDVSGVREEMRGVHKSRLKEKENQIQELKTENKEHKEKIKTQNEELEKLKTDLREAKLAEIRLTSDREKAEQRITEEMNNMTAAHKLSMLNQTTANDKDKRAEVEKAIMNGQQALQALQAQAEKDKAMAKIEVEQERAEKEKERNKVTIAQCELKEKAALLARAEEKAEQDEIERNRLQKIILEKDTLLAVNQEQLQEQINQFFMREKDLNQEISTVKNDQEKKLLHNYVISQQQLQDQANEFSKKEKKFEAEIEKMKADEKAKTAEALSNFQKEIKEIKDQFLLSEEVTSNKHDAMLSQAKAELRNELNQCLERENELKNNFKAVETERKIEIEKLKAEAELEKKELAQKLEKKMNEMNDQFLQREHSAKNTFEELLSQARTQNTDQLKQFLEREEKVKAEYKTETEKLTRSWEEKVEQANKAWEIQLQEEILSTTNSFVNQLAESEMELLNKTEELRKMTAKYSMIESQMLLFANSSQLADTEINDLRKRMETVTGDLFLKIEELKQQSIWDHEHYVDTLTELMICCEGQKIELTKKNVKERDLIVQLHTMIAEQTKAAKAANIDNLKHHAENNSLNNRQKLVLRIDELKESCKKWNTVVECATSNDQNINDELAELIADMSEIAEDLCNATKMNRTLRDAQTMYHYIESTLDELYAVTKKAAEERSIRKAPATVGAAHETGTNAEDAVAIGEGATNVSEISPAAAINSADDETNLIDSEAAPVINGGAVTDTTSNIEAAPVATEKTVAAAIINGESNGAGELKRRRYKRNISISNAAKLFHENKEKLEKAKGTACVALDNPVCYLPRPTVNVGIAQTESLVMCRLSEWK